MCLMSRSESGERGCSSSFRTRCNRRWCHADRSFTGPAVVLNGRLSAAVGWKSLARCVPITGILSTTVHLRPAGNAQNSKSDRTLPNRVMTSPFVSLKTEPTVCSPYLYKVQFQRELAHATENFSSPSKPGDRTNSTVRPADRSYGFCRGKGRLHRRPENTIMGSERYSPEDRYTKYRAFWCFRARLSMP